MKLMIYETSSIHEFRRNFSEVGANQSEEPAVFRGIPLKRCLLIFSALIFDSRVVAGTPSLAAAPDGPDTRPWHSRKASSIKAFSSSVRRFKRPGWISGTPGALDKLGRESQLPSTENVSDSLTITDRSITFCNSRMLPGQVYECSRSRLFLSIDVKCLPAFRAYRLRK